MQRLLLGLHLPPLKSKLNSKWKNVFLCAAYQLRRRMAAGAGCLCLLGTALCVHEGWRAVRQHEYVDCIKPSLPWIVDCKKHRNRKIYDWDAKIRKRSWRWKQNALHCTWHRPHLHTSNDNYSCLTGPAYCLFAPQWAMIWAEPPQAATS